MTHAQSARQAAQPDGDMKACLSATLEPAELSLLSARDDMDLQPK